MLLDTAQLYFAGFGNAETEVIFKSAAITAIICAILSAAAVLYIFRKRKK